MRKLILLLLLLFIPTPVLSVTGKLGLKSTNAMVPLSAVTKRTKEVKLSVVLDAPATTIIDSDIYGIAYADSNNEWWLVAQGLVKLAIAVTDMQFRINGISIYNSSLSPSRIAVGVAGDATGSYTPVGVYPSTGRFRPTGFTSSDLISVDIKVKLASQPTDDFVGNDASFSTFADCLENVPDIAAYMPPASTTEAGYVTTGPQDIAGLKDFTEGVDIASVDGSFYQAGTFTPEFNGNPLTAGSAYGSYTKIGRMVFIQIDFITFSLSGASGSVRIDGLPFPAYQNSSTVYYGNYWSNATASFSAGADVQPSIAAPNSYITISQNSPGTSLATWISDPVGKYLRITMTYQTSL